MPRADQPKRSGLCSWLKYFEDDELVAYMHRKLKPGFDELIESGNLGAVETVKVGKFIRFRFAEGHTRFMQGEL